MVIKFRRVMLEAEDKGRLRKMKDYLIGYSTNNKEHVYMLNEATKYLQRKDCVRIILEKGDLENDL